MSTDARSAIWGLMDFIGAPAKERTDMSPYHEADIRYFDELDESPVVTECPDCGEIFAEDWCPYCEEAEKQAEEEADL